MELSGSNEFGVLLLVVEDVGHHDGATGNQGDDEDDEEDVDQMGRDVQVLRSGAIAERPAVVTQDFAIPGLHGEDERQEAEAADVGVQRGAQRPGQVVAGRRHQGRLHRHHRAAGLPLHVHPVHQGFIRWDSRTRSAYPLHPGARGL